MKGNFGQKKANFYVKALEYASRGYSVMPLYIDKKPRLNSWKKLQLEPAADAQIAAWWQRFPDANIGVITGKISGITVIDIDDPKATPLDTFPKTFTVKTPTGGFHLYYKYAEGYTVSANAYARYPHVDIRGDGGFVVAPPSHCEYEKNGKKISGDYVIERKVPVAEFPVKLFPKQKKRTLKDTVGVTKGGRNDSIASVAGRLLRSEPDEKKWQKDVYPALLRINATYTPPVAEKELRTTFDSIVRKERERKQGLVESPFFEVEGEEIKIPLRRNQNGGYIKDMANALAVLEHHPYYKGTIKYNEFRQEIEYKGRTLEDADVVKIQYFMQKNIGLSSISGDAVLAAIQYYAAENSYDEVMDWLKSLKWDKKSRLATWLHKAAGVDNDAYHAGIGAQWMLGLVRRMVQPGSIFDYVLVLVGAQGIGKTSLFRIIGGKWYKNYTGAMDNKDFFLALRGAIVMDLDEGASLYRSDAIKIKSIITNTHDEYRAPYGRLVKKYPRRFVFSMSTNDTEPFHDVTGNRRYWVIDAEKQIDFKWLEKNREQLFAEAYWCLMKGKKLPDVPMDIALERQETHLPDDSWSGAIVNQVRKSAEYCRGDVNFATTVAEVYEAVFGKDKLDRLGRAQEMRISNVFKKVLGLEKKRVMVDNEQRMRWILSPQKVAQLQEKNAKLYEDDGTRADKTFGEM